jgi:hypothetical protein
MKQEAYSSQHAAMLLTQVSSLVRLAGGCSLVLICCERKILLAGRCQVAGADLM